MRNFLISSYLARPQQKKDHDIFRYSEASSSPLSNGSSGKAIGGPYKALWANHRTLRVLKTFWTASSAGANRA